MPYQHPPVELRSGIPLSGSGPLPDASLYPVGALWVYNGEYYKNRIIGSFVNAATTTKVDYVTNTVVINPNNDFSIDIVFKQDASDSVSHTGLFCCGSATVSARSIWVERDGYANFYNIRLYNSAGASLASSLVSFDGLFNKITFKKISGIIYTYKNNILIGSVDFSSLGLLNQSALTTIGAQQASRTMNGKIACVKYAESGVVKFHYEFDEGSGSTIFDKSDNGNNGILTDGAPNTFWSNREFVPMSLQC